MIPKKLKDFKNFMYLVWKHLNLPDPTPVQYDIADWHMQTEACEQFIEDKGHNLTNCEWMCHKDGAIKFDYPKEVTEDLRRIDINMDGTREICG